MNTSGNPGIGDLAVIGNCQVAGILDQRARLVWACLPRPDADPVFCSLLSADEPAEARGVFELALIDGRRSDQSYLRNTAVLETRLTDGHGNEVLITDFCPRFRQNGRIFRPATFVRVVSPQRGKPQLLCRFQPASHYGSVQPALSAGSHHLRFALPEMNCRLTTDASLTALLESRPVVLEGPLAFVLGADQPIEQPPLMQANAWLAQTADYWREWVRSLAIPFDWQEAVIRAAITLKLCTYEDTGAVLAALTTSLPEAANSGRNWDYRYCWLRDSYFVVQALNRLGATRTMEGYLRYISNIVAQSPDGRLQPLYAITGNADLTETVATSLDGFRGMGPVRIGNAAAMQRQYDVYGAVVLAASQYFYDARLNAPGDEALLQQLELLGRHAIALYEQPDSGPWELRGQERPHTFSAVMCWAACDRLARIRDQLGTVARASQWRSEAARLRERILRRCWSEQRHSLVSQCEGSELDATLLLLPDLGILPANDPRFAATLAAIEQELRVGDLMFRYRVNDDFGRPQNAFTVCSFWYVNALAAAGRMQEARDTFERLLQRRNPLGLLSEDIDVETGGHWGNFPQTYSMVGIISSAVRLSRSWEQAL